MAVPDKPILPGSFAGCFVAADTEELARAAGVVCAVARTADVVDAFVVVLARQLAAPVVTSDPSDLRRLAQAVGFDLTVHQV